ncbi:Nitrate reductase [Aquimixticola soesokkakensis]|uniref:Nitrate reductase n=1 Tax=Aquimixticola soesokkakensis TaxID=1519096 RepID=A0A1Y5SPJ5_9RHOB|nr:nitrate reductase [Aquimixticola soesokkakensis]SLN44838.1 Nitrate reductase [Aquimixticola soesokkakensis]
MTSLSEGHIDRSPRKGAGGGASTCTTCPYCGVGCGVIATPDFTAPTPRVEIAGDTDHPANFGRLCVKGMALGETVSTEGRLLHPQVYGQKAGWSQTLDLVASRFAKTIEKHGPDSVALYVSGQLLSEDYYVANKLMKGFVGSANIDTNSRLCMASSVAGHKRAFGTDTVPGTYEDLEEADLVVLTGSNLAWCHPVLYQRIAAAKAARPTMRVVNIDPRRTATCDLSDLHLPLAPGSDVALFNGLLAAIAKSGAVDDSFVETHVNGFDAALAAAQAVDLSVCDLDAGDIATFFDWFCSTEKTVTVYSQGVNQSSAGADKVNAILNCHLATGRIGRAGMGPFSVTGQPNAMGGREVGGLANMLACHLDLENANHRDAVQGFWNAPVMADKAGLKAVDMFEAVGSGKIKAIWIICTNPVVSMPDADAVKAALEGCDFVVVSDMYATTDTARLAHVVLPATGWGEKDGTVTNSERRISRQRAFLPSAGESRHDWDILSDVARRMGFSGFEYERPVDIFREYAALSGLAAHLGRDFDISGLKDITDAEYEALQPVQWPVSTVKTGGRFFGQGGFFTEDGRARMLPVTHRPPQGKRARKYPMWLNTGRVRDHWHTMTRTALSARLGGHLAEPFLEIHPVDAKALGLKPASLADVTSPRGTATLRVLVTDRLRQGEVFAPMHWTGETAPTGRIDALVAPIVDPVSGQPESKATPVRVSPHSAAWYGFAVSVHEPQAGTRYWAKARAQTGWRIELADDKEPADWLRFAARLLDLDPDSCEALTLFDDASGLWRVAFLRDGVLAGALFAARDPVAVARAHVVGQLDQPSGPPILAGRPGADMPDPGATICSCFNVGINTIVSAIEAQGLASVDAIGVALKAGTNCGSCRPELQALLSTSAKKEAAE